MNALQSSLLERITTIKRPRMCSPYPRPAGFTVKEVSREWGVLCTVEYDYRSLVSLATLNRRSSVLERYADKLAIMNINVSRFLFTIAAFELAPTLEPSVKKALDFYLKTDFKHRAELCNQNNEFSDFLHLLKSQCYYEYIFDLAQLLNFSVVVVKYKSPVFYEYTNLNLDSVRSRTPSGYINVLVVDDDVDQWFVKITSKPCTHDFS